MNWIIFPNNLTSSLDSGQKTFKRRRSIINWAFWRGSSIHLDNLPVSPTSPIPGQLFGVSLPDICENDNLPKAVLVSLILGYSTNGKGGLGKECSVGKSFPKKWEIYRYPLLCWESLLFLQRKKNLIKLLQSHKADIIGRDNLAYWFQARAPLTCSDKLEPTLQTENPH